MSFASRLKRTIWGLQEYYYLTFAGLTGIFRPPFYLKDTLTQMEDTGVRAVAIVAVLSLFMGMALALQMGSQLAVMGLKMYTGQVVGISIISEIGPVMIAIVFAGRTGAGMASELGSMMLGHQIDTLRVFGIDPVRKLLTPRFISCLVMLPMLTFLGDALSLLGASYISIHVLNQSSIVFWDAVSVVMRPRYVLPGLIKPFLFGLLVATISCYDGISTSGGAAGIRRSTTNSFVKSTILIIVADFAASRVILYMLGQV